ncbi:MAG: AAA family ATPase [Treponema sp.]
MTLQDVQVTHHHNNYEYTLSIDEESVETIKIMELSVLLQLLTYKLISYIISIDKFEMSLYRELIELFLDLFLYVGQYSQLIFTTHDQDLLDFGLLRDDEVWFCHKANKYYSVYHSITDYTGIRKGVSRKKLYNADKFGALPLVKVNALKELFRAKKSAEKTK